MLTAALRPNAYLAESTNHMMLSLINRETTPSLYRFYVATIYHFYPLPIHLIIAEFLTLSSGVNLKLINVSRSNWFNVLTLKR